MADFKAGEVVLTKLKSYPKWPSIVMPWNHIPERVYTKKHKLEMAEGKPCVMFFERNASQFFFPPIHNVSIITRKEAQEIRDNYSKSKFNMEGIRYSYDEMLDYMDDDEDEAVKFERLLRNKGLIGDDEEFEMGPAFPEPLREPHRKPTHRKAATNNPTNTKRKSPNGAGQENDSNGGLQTKKMKENPHDMEDQITSKCREFRSVLQRRLLQRKDDKDTPSKEETEICDRSIDELVDFAKEVTDAKYLYASKLHKVLKAIQRKPNLEELHGIDFHKRALLILETWEPLLEQLKLEKGRSSVTPNSPVLHLENHSTTLESTIGVIETNGNIITTGKVKNEGTTKLVDALHREN